MSKIGKKNIIIPKESSIKIEGANLTISGPKGTKKLTIDDINLTARNNIDKDNFVVVVVGNKYSLKDKLAKFGKVQEIKIK